MPLSETTNGAKISTTLSVVAALAFALGIITLSVSVAASAVLGSIGTVALAAVFARSTNSQGLASRSGQSTEHPRSDRSARPTGEGGGQGRMGNATHGLDANTESAATRRSNPDPCALLKPAATLDSLVATTASERSPLSGRVSRSIASTTHRHEFSQIERATASATPFVPESGEGPVIVELTEQVPASLGATPEPGVELFGLSLADASVRWREAMSVQQVHSGRFYSILVKHTYWTTTQSDDWKT